MKVLVSAYACEPGNGSEPGVGWTWARAAAVAGHEVWLVTRANNRSQIERALEREPGLPLKPFYFDLPRRWRRWKRGSRGARAYYVLWQWAIRRRLIALHRGTGFDIAHHLTFAVDWLPASALHLPRVPSVWGPVGGAGSVPLSLYRYLGVRGTVLELARETLVRPLRRLFGDRAARSASLVLCQNAEVAERFAPVARATLIEPNVALPADYQRSPEHRGAKGGSPRVATFVGRLIPWKGLHLAVSALARLDPDWRLEVIGDGPERERCHRLARRLGVADRVQFVGQIPRDHVLERLSASDVALMPSMHDAAGWAVAEAGLAGTPAVSLALGGPAIIGRTAGGQAVAIGPRLPERLAQAVREATTAEMPPSPWTEERLPRFLDGIYRSIQSSTAAKEVVNAPRTSGRYEAPPPRVRWRLSNWSSHPFSRH
jgi:glycosyltransferase involved in cell wall biosynthesis